MVMIVMATYDEICDDCEDNNDETGGRGTQGHNCNFKHFNPAYMMIWMMITMMMTIIDDDDDECETILYILQVDGLLTT